MTNKEWLDYLAHNAPDELAAWFDAEHAEHQERALDGDTAALEAKIAELTEKLRIGWECECRLQAERDKLKADLEAAYTKNRSLRQHISQMQNGRNEWHVKAVRLEKQLEVTNKRCEEYRSKFGKCIDYADAIHALMDEGMA